MKDAGCFVVCFGSHESYRMYQTYCHELQFVEKSAHMSQRINPKSYRRMCAVPCRAKARIGFWVGREPRAETRGKIEMTLLGWMSSAALPSAPLGELE